VRSHCSGEAPHWQTQPAAPTPLRCGLQATATVCGHCLSWLERHPADVEASQEPELIRALMKTSRESLGTAGLACALRLAWSALSLGQR
jgi:hypothetical protein